jgi:uncharacterized protein RhaS with RHS repeats
LNPDLLAAVKVWTDAVVLRVTMDHETRFVGASRTRHLHGVFVKAIPILIREEHADARSTEEPAECHAELGTE